MVCYALLVRLDPAQSRLKVTRNLLSSAKIAENKLFLMKKANSLLNTAKNFLTLYEQFFSNEERFKIALLHTYVLTVR